jgi:sigma-B regulation protein RsbU (phosphoserine phosphatase)
METRILSQFRESVLQKRNRLIEWRRTTTPSERQLRLGPADEGALRRHLDILDDTAKAADAQSLGICAVCHGSVEDRLLELDYTCCVCLEHFSADQMRSLETELELAQSVQRSLLPQSVPQSRYLQTAAFSRPAQIVGGDYFGFYSFKDGSDGVAIADVAGHGISASMHVAGMHALLQSLVPASTSAAATLEQVHGLFVHNVNFTTFVTAFLSAYNPRTRTLTYCNAGHNPPLLITEGRSGQAPVLRRLRPTSPAIGLVEGARFDEATVQVNPGDLLVLYTDGVTEATNEAGEELGEERLACVAQEHVDEPSFEILQALRRELERHVHGRPAADDTTIVVQKIIE